MWCRYRPKGLVAKITADDVLLETSGLPALEEAPAKGIMGRRQSILRAAVLRAWRACALETSRSSTFGGGTSMTRWQSFAACGVRNASVIESMRHRIEQEQREFDLSTAKIQAVRAVHLKLLRDVFQQLGAKALKGRAGRAGPDAAAKGLKLGVKKNIRPDL